MVEMPCMTWRTPSGKASRARTRAKKEIECIFSQFGPEFIYFAWPGSGEGEFVAKRVGRFPVSSVEKYFVK